MISIMAKVKGHKYGQQNEFKMIYIFNSQISKFFVCLNLTHVFTSNSLDLSTANCLKFKYSVKMEHQQTSNGDSIQVVVRIRPGCEDEAVVYTHNEIKLDRHSFAFDRVFGPNSQQQELFTAVGKRLLTHTLQGYNSCIFVYGQTGSGKTFTMMGNNSGMMQRSFCELFARIDRMADSECIVTCSYYELYNQQIIDLLDKTREKKNLNIRQDVRKGVFVENLIEEQALTADKLLDCLMTGMKNRHIGETQMNRESSRSHSIFTISLAIKSEIDGKKVLKTPKLHFVDLAGSQRQKMTMASGDRLKQAGNINKSLTTLGMVINALASDRPKVHIPYRDSKLTCLLRDSLGGNSKTFIVATISTSMLSFQETLSTLNFANRAKMVKVKALVNQESLSTNLEQYKEEIRKLRQEIQRLKSQKRVNFETSASSDTVISKNSADLQHKFEVITHKIQDLKTNMMSTSMDSLIERLQRGQGEIMTDEGAQLNTEDMEAQGNELIEYMVSNHDLLKKIHSTISEYRDLKEQIKNVEFNRRMPMEDMRTPSKFERDQYEDLLIRREGHIKELQERIIHLKELNFKREVEIKELKKKMMASEHNQHEQSYEMQKLRMDQSEQEKRLGEIQLKCQMLEEERRTLRTTVDELESRVKEFKQLYHYSEEKYENERFLRNKLENTIKDLNKKSQQLQAQKRQEFEEFKSKIEGLQQKLLEGERREEDLKSEQEILSETLEFNKRKMREYADKLQEANKQLQQASFTNVKQAQNMLVLQIESDRMKIELRSTIDQLNHSMTELQSSKALTQQNLIKIRNEKVAICEEMSSLKETFKNQVELLANRIQFLEQEKLSLIYEYDEYKVNYHKTVTDYQIKVFGLQKNISNLMTDRTTLCSWKSMMEEKYQSEKTIWQDETLSLKNEVESIRNQREYLRNELQERHKKMSELQAFVNANKNIIEAHEQLKKTYKEVVKDNYRLKGQYQSNGVAARNQELVSKVSFYEEKFKLMSIEYNKVQETTKKLKQKELALMKKIQYFEENEKLKKIHSFSEAEEAQIEHMRALQTENEELKESLQKAKSTYQAMLGHQRKEDYSKRLTIENERYELEQREEKIRRRLESAIKNWDHAKENNCSGMNLDELFNCWSKIETESRKKFEGIAKAIKREQKLKSQNSFILKENFFLRERLQALQKDFNMQALGNPRKLLKSNEGVQDNQE